MSSYTYEKVQESSFLPVHFEYIHSAELTIPAHWHEYLEILLGISGHLIAVIQAETYHLYAGDILIMNSNEIHMTQTPEAGTEYILLQVSARTFQQFFPNFPLLHFATRIPNHERSARHGSSASDILMDMLHIYEQQKDGYPLHFTARLYDLLYCLYQNYSYWLTPDSQKTMHRDFSRIIQTMNWIGENYKTALTLDEAAANLGLSREYFCRIFKKYTGQTFLEYLNDVRVMRFHDELLSSDDSITNLMASHGISNYKIFLRTFKKLYGVTPQKMRNQTYKPTYS